ncbi:Hypothetical_protein [Hexamita inflata]|uniref:Hypothetical_protein n=1 Tax=Hexamita inflata TaxID=28002 RepID=A0AA86UQC6_9EUKA|nr:Hypothetical protein HINF_LOCUS48257 [Hexamita inflata]
MDNYFDMKLQLSQMQLANEKELNILIQEQLSNEKAWNQELINELESKCNQLEQLLQLYETTVPQNDQIQQANAGLQTSFQNCSQNNQSISINTSYTQIYTQQQNRINEYEKYIAQLLASNEKIKSQYDDLNSKISDKLQEIDKINSKDKEKALENPLQIDPELLNCKNRDIQYYQQQYENVNRKYICAQDEYELIKQRNNQQHSKVQQLEAEIARLNEKLKLKENTCERLQSESKCPLMNTIQELQAQNQQYINHINEIKAQYSLQFQQSEKEKRNLIQEIQSQTKINENLTHYENSLEREIAYLIKNQGLSIFIAELYQAVSSALNAVDNIDFSVDKNQLEKNLFATVQQLEDSQIITEAFWLDLANKLQIELHLTKLLYHRVQYFSEKDQNQQTSNVVIKMAKLIFEYQQELKISKNSVLSQQSQIISQNKLVVSQLTQQQIKIFGTESNEQIQIEPQFLCKTKEVSEYLDKEISIDLYNNEEQSVSLNKQFSSLQQNLGDDMSKEHFQSNQELPVSQSQLSRQQQNIVQQMNEQHDIISQQSSFDDQRPLSQPTPEIISKIFYEATKNVLNRYFNIQSENMNQTEISNQIEQLNQDQQETLWENIVQISNCFETVDAAQSYFTTTFKYTYYNTPDIFEVNLNTSLDQVSQPENEGKQQNITNQSITINEQQIKSYEQETENKQKQDNKQKVLETQKFDQFTVAVKQVLNKMYSEQNFSNMAPKELCVFMNSQKRLAKGFWDNVAQQCNQKLKTLMQYYSRTYSKVLYSEKRQNDKTLIQCTVQQVYQMKNGSIFTVHDIAKFLNEKEFSKRDLFIFDIEHVVAAELKKLKNENKK